MAARKHLARFVVEVVEGAGFAGAEREDCGSGSASYHPSMLLGLLVLTVMPPGGVSSRKLERR